MSGLLAFTFALVSASSPLLGEWTLMGQPFASFQKNGHCIVDGEPCTWRVNGGTLFITGDGETDAVAFQVAGRSLTLQVNGVPIVLERPGSATPAAQPVAPAVAPASSTPSGPAGGKATKVNPNDPLAKLILSSPWCTFRYNQTTGYSSSTRIQYFRDGTYQLGARGEGYSSGYGGTLASQHDSGSSGRWMIQKGVLHMTPPPSDENPQPTQFLPVPLQIKRNSNGFPIVVADGNEYSQCE